MFSTFTGNSRRTRNVNLSGQKYTNPFASNSFSPSAPTGAAKTVADAQAERRLRQLERDRLKAAQSIQRVWRGYTSRRKWKASQRQVFDELYNSESTSSSADRRPFQALPVLFAFFDASIDDDCQRLALVAQDLSQDRFRSLTSAQEPTRHLVALVQALIDALAHCGPAFFSPTLFNLLLQIIQTQPDILLSRCQAYYTMLAKCLQMGSAHAVGIPVIQETVSTPLLLIGRDNELVAIEAYEAFASSFLTSSQTSESFLRSLAPVVDMDKLASAIISIYEPSRIQHVSRGRLLWLLAHFIALQASEANESRGFSHIKALYVQLSHLYKEIRDGIGALSTSLVTETEQPSRRSLDPFIVAQLQSLVKRDNLLEVLNKFTSAPSKSASESLEESNQLAGYMLILLRCFPGQADDIRMLLYLADLNSREGRVPSVKFFWKAMRQTTAFARVASNPDGALNFLLQRIHFKPPSIGSESVWDQEWRTVLLFLELYVFVLRLTDDEDFHFGIQSSLTHAEARSRVQLCAMALDDLKPMTVFLKNLAFTLQFHAADLLPDTSDKAQPGVRLERMSNTPSSTSDSTRTFNVIPGMDFADFKNIVTTTIRMLYERDSRRPFLPVGHWLMTAKFDMETFLSAVVIEEQRQHDLQDDGSDEDNEDDEAAEDAMDVDQQAVTFAGMRRSRHSALESLRQRQRRTQRDRMLAMIGPRLEVLRNMPYVIPFDTRVQIFRQFVYLDKQRRRNGNIDPEQWRMHIITQNGGGWGENMTNMARGILGKHHAKIKRGQVFQDAFDQFYKLDEGFKEPIQITFIDKFDTVEAGIDGGGVTKEFLISVTREAFSEQHTMFVANSQNALYPNPYALDQAKQTLIDAGVQERDIEWRTHIADLLERFEFLGRVVGKCLYEGILIDVAFAGFFLLKWSTAGTDSGYRANINDLREMDEQLYQGMLRLKDQEGDISELGLDFTISDQVSLPNEPVKTVTRSLVPDGNRITVTNENRPLYISYMARHRLVRQPLAQTRAFLRGLGSIINPSWLSMFNQSELQRLVGGDPGEIDVEDLRRNTAYSGLYQVGDDGLEHPTVRLFWEVMRGLDAAQRREVLRYVTSTPRAPLLGFAQLKPPFSIRDGGADEDRLPSASTCVNLLKLPLYKTAGALRSKLLYAVTSGAGFDLS